ncbi:hypothetical protein D3C71_1323040 [compost metagenome]
MEYIEKINKMNLSDENINLISEALLREIETKNNLNIDLMKSIVESLLFLDQTFFKVKIDVRNTEGMTNQQRIDLVGSYLNDETTLNFKEESNRYKSYYDLSKIAISTGQAELIKKAIEKINEINEVNK